MKNVLITGARAPAALDLAKKLSLSNLTVYAADSVHHPITRSSKYITKYFVVHPPKGSTLSFIQDLNKIIIENKIDILIPTCEEVFFISYYKELLSKHCLVFCDAFEKISKMHNKYEFISLAKDCGIYTPKTTQISSTNEYNDIKNPQQNVFKPTYSRFASHVFICPNKKSFSNLKKNQNFPWVAQEYIKGTEYCTYSIAVSGKLKAHSCYQPLYKVGKGAGVYFSPMQNKAILDFVSNFVKKHNYTGQIGFDFIVNSDNQVYVIECNPRATSGIHCLDNNHNWLDIFLGKNKQVINSSPTPKMISLAMLFFGGKYLFNKPFGKIITDFLEAKDSIYDKKDALPFFYQLVSVAEILFTSIKKRCSITKASTSDIEWDGGNL